MPEAIALLSGGLDSTLAVLVLLRQGINVTAVSYLTHFGCDISDKSSCSSDASSIAEQFGFTVKLCHLADKFIDIVKKPKYGHGKNMNPCIDCRILMLKEAKNFMEMKGADFLVTGEVLGQRPMSQRRETFPLIDRGSGCEGACSETSERQAFKADHTGNQRTGGSRKTVRFFGPRQKTADGVGERAGAYTIPYSGGRMPPHRPPVRYEAQGLASS